MPEFIVRGAPAAPVAAASPGPASSALVPGYPRFRWGRPPEEGLYLGYRETNCLPERRAAHGLCEADALRVRGIRRIGDRFLEEWGFGRLRPLVGTLISELAANAVQHGHGHVKVVWAWTLKGLLLTTAHENTVRVRPPATDGRAEPDGFAESGRGLLLVDAQVDRWGAHGGTVWCCLDLAGTGR
ncbi:ATP-binding protein [Streptomyces sp. NPDC097619]|uniref:ATP-binding protein n=1 Tax=Streptomyces sp. NPDC097619 TaxID=3157228 RepID=UPI0033257E65